MKREHPQKKGQGGLIGIGLDNEDGHKRITRAERFAVVGGSEETHGHITETLVKTFETLKRKGKDIDDTQPEELRDIIADSANG